MAEIDVPIISIKGFYSDSAEERKAVVEEIKNACLKCGFFMIKDHGADMKIIDHAWKACREFFDSPLQVKESAPMVEDYPYGYVGIQKEIAGGSYEYGSADMKESFSLCLGPSPPHTPDPRMPAPRWPVQGPVSFPPAVSAYFFEMERLARILLRIFALALDVDEHFFDPFEDKHWSALRCLNYPHSDKPFAPGQMRIAAHTDYGTLTILRADNVPGGLQVQKKDGSWQDVVFPPDCFTINLGDLMQRWTNDMWKSTCHRVVPPVVVATATTATGASGAGAGAGAEVQVVATTAMDNRRQSIAFFHNLNRDAVCSTFASCISASHPSKYQPINAFDHLMARHAQAVGHTSRLESTTTTNDTDSTTGVGSSGGNIPSTTQKVGGGDITGAAWKQAAAGAAAAEEGGKKEG